MISEIISKYHSLSQNYPHHRFKSWEHCHSFFFHHYKTLRNQEVFDHGSLHLAFYLASWGMLRGSSFLLQKDYKVHTYFLKNIVLNPDYHKYFTKSDIAYIDYKDIEGIDKLITDTKSAYENNIHEINGDKVRVSVTNTLASKILLGVFGNVPAYDRYFKDALSLFGIRVYFDENSLMELAEFYNRFVDEFQGFRDNFIQDGVHYTPMKLIDMYFWQIGYMMDHAEMFKDELKEITRFAQQYKSINRQKIVKKSIQKTSNNPLKQVGLTDLIRNYIFHKLSVEKREGKDFLDLRSGDIHKEMGLMNRMPAVCNAMISIGVYRLKILSDTPSGMSSTKVVRYYLKE
ncbi:hypothetical protein [Neobacillus cucumis]|uniref:Uncharacterized protein n=1 Tax=Neobacillus cucumis TaxID=1740721 RepID=A0A2N5H8U9_9BACI|nr:hypothetical protein [Neobacillus cucumis]PLS01925.1 hypothetical protein CVD27_22680 [Neobacillus cucumis]